MPSFYPENILKTGVKQLHDQGFTGKGVKIAVLDTGIDVEHPALKPQIKATYNYTDEDDGVMSIVTDRDGHGTHVAGIIAANSPTLMGMAPDADLYIYKVIGDGGANPLRITQTIRHAISQGVNIIHMSIQGEPLEAMHIAIQEAVAANILVVAAAGNSGPGSVDYPAGYHECVSVGAYSTYNMSVSGFSDTNDEIDLVAPGEQIFSSMPVAKGNYGYMSGTSMAAPHVTGAAACIKQKWEHIHGRTITEPELFAELVKNVGLLSGASVKEQGNGYLLLNSIALPTPEELTDREAIYGLCNMNTSVHFDSPEFWLNLIEKFEADPERYEDFRFVGLGFRKAYVMMLELMQK